MDKFSLVDPDDFEYDLKSGSLFRVDGRRKELKATRGGGYITFMYKRNHFQAHRMIWFLHYGSEPKGQIDHINHVRNDNRIENLRVVSASENSRNKSFSSRNTSGRTGVTWSKQINRWLVSLSINGATEYCGCFKEFSEAASAREAAEIKHGFHPNHEKVKPAKSLGGDS